MTRSRAAKNGPSARYKRVYLGEMLPMLTPAEWTHIWKQIIRDDPCAYCGYAKRDGLPWMQFRAKPKAGRSRVWKNNRPEADHIEPRASGRVNNLTHEWEDLTNACKRCNQRKGSKGMLFYMLELLEDPEGEYEWR